MAPGSSKGTGKKGGAAAVVRQRDHAQSPQMSQQPRSRNNTPAPAAGPSASLPHFETVETETVELRFDVFRNLTFEDLVDPAAANVLSPDSTSLDGLLSRLQKLADVIDKRGSYCDRGMRLLAQSRRQRMDEMALERGREEDRNDDSRKTNKKKRKGTDSLAPNATSIGQSMGSPDVFCFFFGVVGGCRRHFCFFKSRRVVFVVPCIRKSRGEKNHC
jgi:transcriptional adapter 3